MSPLQKKTKNPLLCILFVATSRWSYMRLQYMQIGSFKDGEKKYLSCLSKCQTANLRKGGPYSRTEVKSQCQQEAPFVSTTIRTFF